MIPCPSYATIYYLWITGQATRDDLECHARECAECRRQAAELTQAAARANNPDLTIGEIERIANEKTRA